MSGRNDTLAGRSFSEAEGVLHGLALPSTSLAPPLDFRIPVVPLLEPASRGALPGVAFGRTGASDGPVPATPMLAKGPTLTEALRDLARGATTTRDLVEAALIVVADTMELGAVVALDDQAVRQEADVLDRERLDGHLHGPLHGIPVTVKDIIDADGLPTRAGSLAYSDEAPGDAIAVARLRSAGALILAKVATHEFALGVATPQCCNPHDPTRISGGSSGGSAIAVATGIGLASLGTDTRASLRVPAHCCGVVGFKPTYGRVPTGGTVPLSWTIDHLGPVTRTVRDAAVVLNVLADSPFLTSEPPDEGSEFTVGINSGVYEDCDEEVATACEQALAMLERLGTRIVEVPGPSIDDLEVSNALGLLVSRSEAATFHRSQRTDLERCIPEVRDQLTAGLTITAVDYLDAQRQRLLLGERTLSNFNSCDVVVSPTAPIVAPLRTDYERYLLRLSRNTIIWSLIGAPAVSLPCGASSAGIPVGLQFAAPPGQEQRLVTLGMMFERELARMQ